MQLPLREDFFTVPAISLDAKQAWHDVAVEALQERLDLDCLEDGGVHWSTVEDVEGVQVSMGEVQDGTLGDIGSSWYYRAVTKVQASVQELMALIIASTTENYKQTCRKLYPNFLDGAVLCNAVEPCAEHPYQLLGVRWLALQSKAPLADRDYCLLELADVRLDEEENEVGVHVCQSIEVPFCRRLDDHQLVRGSMNTAGFVFSPLKDGSVEISYICQVDLGGDAPARSIRKNMQCMAQCVDRLRKLIENRALKHVKFMPKESWVDASSRAFCRLCTRKFNAFRPKHHCRVCGEVLCGKCSLSKSVQLPVVGTKKIRMCLSCTQSMGNASEGSTGRPSIASSEVSQRFSSSSSAIDFLEVRSSNGSNLAQLEPGNTPTSTTSSNYLNNDVGSNVSGRSLDGGYGNRGSGSSQSKVAERAGASRSGLADDADSLKYRILADTASFQMLSPAPSSDSSMARSSLGSEERKISSPDLSKPTQTLEQKGRVPPVDPSEADGIDDIFKHGLAIKQ